MDGGDRYIGKQIGNYVISSSLNSGAFGHVYKGTHLYLSHRIVAIKILHLTHLASEEERESFLQEAEFLEMLKHAHILPIYDVGIDEGFPSCKFSPKSGRDCNTCMSRILYTVT
jgi:serine/threonine protein kinase